MKPKKTNYERKYNIVLSDIFKKKSEELPKREFDELMSAIEAIARNPYCGEPVGTTLLERIHNKFLWIKMEINLRMRGE